MRAGDKDETMRLTDLAIKTLAAPEKGATIYADDNLAGFGVRVSEGGTKSYVLTHGRLRKRETIGRVGIIDLKSARSEAKRRLAEYTLGKTQTRAMGWNTALETYLGQLKLKQRTIDGYRRLLTKHFRFGDTPLSEITPKDIQDRLNKLSSTPVEQHHAFVVLRTFFRWLHHKHLVDENPMERMRTTHRYKPRSRILTDAELRKVWTATEDNTFGCIVRLLILTGQRVGEVSKLSRDMIGEDTITLPSWLTKNGREHTLPLSAAAVCILKKTKQGRSAQLLFPARGQITKPFNGFSKSKLALDKRSGVKAWTLHDLRRTFASGLAAQGVSIEVVEKLLNHISGSFAGIVGVYQRYDYLKEMREAVELWDRHIQTLTA